MQQLMGKNLKIKIPTSYSDEAIYNIEIHFVTHNKNKYMTEIWPPPRFHDLNISQPRML